VRTSSSSAPEWRLNKQPEYVMTTKKSTKKSTSKKNQVIAVKSKIKAGAAESPGWNIVS